MEPWPLERVANLEEPAFRLLLLAFTRSVLARREPLPLPGLGPEAFAGRSWQDLGLDSEALSQVSRQFQAMFSLELAAPALVATPGHLVDTALAAWRGGPRPVTFFTSGSTGQPKPCTHLEEHLRQEVAHLADLFGRARAALVTVPHFHLYGFTFGLLLPLSLGLPIRCLPPLPPLVAAQMTRGDLVVGIPLLWSRLATAGLNGQGITALTATSPIPAEAMRGLAQSGFDTIEIYGSSETGAIGYRQSPEEYYHLLGHWRRGRPDDPDQGLARTLPEDRQAYYPLQDQVEWMGDRRLLPLGRRDQAVRIAGHSVYAQRVAAVLAGHEGVKQCLVRLMRPEEGQRLKAFVVPKPRQDLARLRKELLALVRRQLSDPERPAQITFGPKLPLGALGKPGDW